MKEDKAWIQQMRKQLKDYSEPLPDDLWKAIEKDLEKSEECHKVIPFWKRWQAVAAVAAVLIVSLSAVWLWRYEEKALDGHVRQTADVTKHIDESWLPVQNKVEPASSVNQLVQGVSSLLKAVTTSLPVSDESDDKELLVAQADVCSSIIPDTLELSENETTEKLSTPSGQERDSRRTTDRNRIRNNALLAVAGTSSADRRWQIGITTGNSLYSASNNFQGFSSLATRADMQTTDDLAMNAVSDDGMAYTQVLFHNRDRVSETRVHHRMPVTVGATLSYAFSDRWSLETGLNYTLLSSELHTGTQSYMEEEQKLHYVGIPLKLKYNFWKNKRLVVYAVAGGMVEKCVSGELETLYVTGSSDRKSEHTSLDVKPLQWSVNAAVGGQFNLIPQLGIYVEPGVAYYFDDGSSLETFRKEHPCNFNLQVGLRFTLSK